jgi:transposase
MKNFIEQVRRKIQQVGEELIIITHSFYILITYRNLMNNSTLLVCYFLSLASPLGYKVVYQAVERDLAQLVNVYIREDLKENLTFSQRWPARGISWYW